MAKTRRLISERLRLVDIVVELVDARIPHSSRNPDIRAIVGAKPMLTVLNKCDMADSGALKKWVARYKADGIAAVPADSISGKGIGQFKHAVDNALADKIKRDLDKGMKKRPAKMMIVGIPNVGKSSFINKLAGRAGAKTGDTPGVTRAEQWIRISGGYELLDTPGILWPRFDDERTGLRLAFTGAVRDEVYDVTRVGAALCEYLAERFPSGFSERYGITADGDKRGYDLLREIGGRRGCLISGGEIDLERAARILLDEFRSCRLGNITLELPEEYDE
jgi:ribosome biogenesis GTPase A